MKPKRTSPKATQKLGIARKPAAVVQGALLGDVRELIASARQQVATAVNAALTMLYWHVGERIRREVLQEKRAEYGADIVATLSRQLVEEFGPGWSRFSL